jgi:hypothetical protein
MHDVSGVTGAAPIWRDLIHRLHEAEPSIKPIAPTDQPTQNRLRLWPGVAAVLAAVEGRKACLRSKVDSTIHGACRNLQNPDSFCQ